MNIMRASFWFVGTILAIVFGSVLYSAFCKYPEYSRGRADEIHPFVESCKKFQQGSDLESVNQILEQSPEPFEQTLDDKRLVIRWESGECTVEFDPSTKHATKIESRAFTGVRWMQENY